MTKDEARKKVIELYIKVCLGKKWLDFAEEEKAKGNESINNNIFEIKLLNRLDPIVKELGEILDEHKGLLREPETNELMKVMITPEYADKLAKELFTFKDFNPYNTVENVINYFLNM